MSIVLALALLSLLAWTVLLARSGRRAAPRLRPGPGAPPGAWPEVVAIVPARDEAAHVARALGSLLRQDYPGGLTIVLVDDHSSDATRPIARSLETGAGALTRLEVIGAPALPAGWSGKLWAMSAGLCHAEQLAPSARYLLLTDADVEHAPDNLARLVCKAEREGQDLVSLMVRLACASFWERLLIPPFVFFFQLLYPFDAVNDPASRVAAAAGGCVLVRRQALHEAGGLAPIRGALIDDVALARAIKRRPGGGRIWLGLGDSAQSLRRYERLGEIWAMVARTADTQLRHSLLLLLGAVLGMTLLYAVPPLALLGWPLHGNATAALLGGAGWTALVLAYQPTARSYGLAWPWWPSLPVAAGLFTAMTIDSAIRHRRGIGGRWKGRVMTPEA